MHSTTGYPQRKGRCGDIRSTRYLIAISLVFFALAVSAFTLYDQDGSDAADSITRKGVVYESDGIGSAVVTDFDTRAADVDRDVDILAEVTIVGTKYPVKSIKEGAFK